MKPTNTVAKLFSSVSTFAVMTSVFVAGVAMGQGGQVVAWGNNNVGQCNSNAVSPATQIAVGIGINYRDGYTLALKVDGTVIGTGSVPIPWPSNLGKCTQIASGYSHCIALQVDGNIKTWGFNIDNVPSDIGLCTQIAAGGRRSAAIKNNGTISYWGLSSYNNLVSDTYIKVAVSNSNIAAVTSSGEVVVEGSSFFGQTLIPANLGACTDIAVGETCILVIRVDGIVVAWGGNQNGQCGSADESVGPDFNNNSDSRRGAYWVKTTLGPCKAISSNQTPEGDYALSMAIKNNGSVVSWYKGQTNEISATNNLGACTKVAAGTAHSAVIQVPLPVITGVLPISGASTGGTNITITGTNFFNPSTVTIGGVPAINVVVVSDTQITATTPAGFPGPAVVTVNLGSSTAFYYRPTCGSDLDNSGVVDSGDISIVLLDFGSCSESAAVAPQQEPLILQAPEPAKSVPQKNNEFVR
ncbi:MAG: IPT/TIG domain-containing protein [Opitutaceae bacterium]